ncbi:MAG: hypothetical protein ACI9DM_001239 [Cyclobacteriaceae bacterium]|jgi:hypothetical protein
MRIFIASVLIGLMCLSLNAQVIQNITLRSQGGSFNSEEHALDWLGERHTYFAFSEENEVFQIALQLKSLYPNVEVNLVPSIDFDLQDTLLVVGNQVRFKIKFTNLNEAELLRLSFQVLAGDLELLEEYPLLPVSETFATIYPNDSELFIGEEKSYELVSNQLDNLRLDYRWQETPSYNYRYSRNGDQAFLHLIPTQLGQLEFNLRVPLRMPRFDLNDSLTFMAEALQTEFTVREGRLVFLQLDKQEITRQDDKREPILVQIDNHRTLQTGKTYRIENQEEKGGPLIAELYTKTRLNNDKILAEMRVYAFHRKSDGYLFIKDGDLPKFVTNVDITPKPKINTVEIQRAGKAWQQTTTIFPGERIKVRLQGEGLHKSKISFQGVNDLSFDSLVRSEELSIFDLEIPIAVSNRAVEIYNYNEPTGKTLNVSEYQKPRPLDFVILDLAGDEKIVQDIDKPIYFERNLTDLVIGFDYSKIDQDNDDLFGKQYLTIDVKLSSKEGNLIEIYRFDEVVVCPGESSPRSSYYDRSDCQTTAINLNSYLARKTHSLDEWSKIQLEISHVKSKYQGKTANNRVQVYLKRNYNFDVDLSFPAGLLILEANSDEFINFGGPSFAMMAQFSFYQEGKIAKYRPFKFGAGFIAIDAFNLANNDNQDIGLVFMGSLHPSKSGKKLTFPLFAGFGYFLQKQTPFFLLGPGIRVRL